MEVCQVAISKLEAIKAFAAEKKNIICFASGSFLLGYSVARLVSLHIDNLGIRQHLHTTFYHYLKRAPIIGTAIKQKVEEARKGLEKSLHDADEFFEFIDNIPAHSLTADQIIEKLHEYNEMNSLDFNNGKCSGAIFHTDKISEDLQNVYRKCSDLYSFANPLWPKLFPAIRKMEAEIVRMCCNLLNGDEETCGTMTTGGTTSIIMACLSYAKRARENGIEYPELIMPESAHAAFVKAAEMFRLKLTRIPVDRVTYRVDIEKMRKAISSRTCMLVGSAVGFPTGAHDDIQAIALLGLKNDIPVHVDACLGGFILPFDELARPFDFRVRGVTSISCDTHKYGLAPKGSSVILYRHKQLLHYQYFCDPDWQGGIYASCSIEGSRAGLNIAQCWATIMYYGYDGYKKYAQDVLAATRKLKNGIAKIKGLILLGECDVCVVAWTGDGIDINTFREKMQAREWQLSGIQFPSGVHLMITSLHTQQGVIEKLLADAEEVAQYLRKNPQESRSAEAALYGMAQKIPDRSIVKEFAFTYLDVYYSAPQKKSEEHEEK